MENLRADIPRLLVAQHVHLREELCGRVCYLSSYED